MENLHVNHPPGRFVSTVLQKRYEQRSLVEARRLYISFYMRRDLVDSFEESCEILHEGFQSIEMNTMTDVSEFGRRGFTAFVV